MGEKDFHNWLEQFIKESGHSFGAGFYVELKTGEFFYTHSDEYKQWYESKFEEYKQNNKI
jgi:hypothetical protein